MGDKQTGTGRGSAASVRPCVASPLPGKPRYSRSTTGFAPAALLLAHIPQGEWVEMCPEHYRLMRWATRARLPKMAQARLVKAAWWKLAKPRSNRRYQLLTRGASKRKTYFLDPFDHL